jgi:nucleoside-diphosphate-sugar epimerase
MKFGTTGNEALTWALNTAVPVLVSNRYRGVRLVALSTGNVYGLSRIEEGGAKESDPLLPVGEYAMSAVGRERIFQHYAEAHHTPTALIRLYYAFELRYGVPVDIAQKIWRGERIDLSMGHASIVWQRDANAQTLLALEHVGVPARRINVSGPRMVRVRDVAERLGTLMDRAPQFVGNEADSALVCNTTLAQQLFGATVTELDQALAWIADWVMSDGQSLGKPTHFEDREGRF